MAVNIQTQHTSRFIDPWPYLALGSALLVFSALIAGSFFPTKLVSTTVDASVDEPVELPPIQLKPQRLGALRIDVRAMIQTNQWVTYEIQVLDQQGKAIASGIKQAWSESGVEEGESWYEDDLLGGLDVRAKRNETVAIAINVLEYGDTSGQELDTPVPFDVTVQNGVVDTRYLWAGLFGTGTVAVVAWFATPLTGKKAIAKTINDSDPNDRATVGGSNRLVRVKIDVESDANSPRQLETRLVINDAYGEQLYRRSFPMRLSFKKENGKIDKATGQVQAFFLLEPRNSYGFHVEVLPDGPVDRTTLTVRDGARTLQSVEVAKISPSLTEGLESPQDRNSTNDE